MTPAQTPSADHLLVERPSDGVVLLTLNNPDQRNAMSDSMTASGRRRSTRSRLIRACAAWCTRVPARAFCSGGNPKWIAGEPEASVDQLRTRMISFYRPWLSIRKLEVPTIAAVNGYAVGAGLCVALAADLRYGSVDAKLSVPFVKLGMHPGMAATYLLPDVVGHAQARDLLLTGRTVEADEALQLGSALTRAPRGDLPRRRARHRRRDRSDRAHPEPPDQGGSPRRRPCGLRVGHPVGGARPADHARDQRPPGGRRGRPREARRRSSPGAERRKRPPTEP